MSVSGVIKSFLDVHEVKYVTIIHSPAFTAQEIASNSFVSGNEFAKTVILKIDDSFIMAVSPAADKVCFGAFKKYLHAKDVRLATEAEFRDLFPGSSTGAMAPFGNIYNMETYISKKMISNKMISFNAGSHTELIRFKLAAFLGLVKPIAIDFEDCT